MTTNNAAPEITQEQIREWREREYRRLHDGTYTRLPSIWTEGRNAYWWIYGLKDREAYGAAYDKSIENGTYTIPRSHPYENHFAHVSTVDGAMVAFTENDQKGVADRQTRMKPGKYLQKYFGDVLTPDQIRDLATAFCAEYAPQKLQFAVTADEIEHVYTHGPSSCMAYTAYDYRSSMHPVRVYGDSDLQVAYIAPQKDRITARALVWPKEQKYFRIYGDGGRLLPLLKDAGYKYGSFEGARIRAVEEDDNFVMPYVDGICEGKQDGKWIVLGCGDICTQPTCGLTRNGPEYRCELCDVGMTSDDAYSCEDVDSYICIGCYENRTTTCERTGDRILRDDAVEMADGTSWSQRSFDRYGFTCPINETNHPRSEGVAMADGDMWSQDAFDDGGFVCAGNGGNYCRSQLVVMQDGALWSKEHFKEYGHEQDGAYLRNADAPLDAAPYRCPDTMDMELRFATSPQSGEIQVGDWVECTSQFGNQFTSGGIYRVKSIREVRNLNAAVHGPEANDGRFDMILVHHDNNGSTTNGWCRQFFRVVSSVAEAA